jgi:hypothetical protein
MSDELNVFSTDDAFREAALRRWSAGMSDALTRHYNRLVHLLATRLDLEHILDDDGSDDDTPEPTEFW